MVETSRNIFSDLEEALVCERVCGSSSDTDVDESDDVIDMKLSEARACFVRLPDGDIHMCNEDCQYTVPDAFGYCVCQYTGLVVSCVIESRSDHCTGRSIFSSDPDHQRQSIWNKKKNMAKASSASHIMARGFDDTVMPLPLKNHAVKQKVARRGALCVDATHATAVLVHRMRARPGFSHDATDTPDGLLVESAITIYDKLLRRPQKCGLESESSNSATDSNVVTSHVDPRLLNASVLYTTALKKYIREMSLVGLPPTLDAAHNIALAVKSIVQTNTQAASSVPAEAASVGGIAKTLEFREYAARLAVSMWTAVSTTPYMKKSKRSSDGFPSFCVGIYYAFKRGLHLPDGTSLIPQIQSFVDEIPTTYEIARDVRCKQLHATSHKGLCTLHRCIASVAESESHSYFGCAVAVSNSWPTTNSHQYSAPVRRKQRYV